MRAARVALAVMATATAVHAASYKVTQYQIQTPDIGSCRLKGIDSNSDNFKYYASVSAKDVTVNEGCARCIKVTKDGVTTSITAYVLDVCTGCKAGELKLSSSALSDLSIDPNTNNATVSYKFIGCPTTFLTGNVKACLMEGASNSYIPLQFYNSQKVIQSASIAGVNATQNKDSFFYFSSPQTGNANGTSWFKSVEVSLTSTDDETKTGTFTFGGTSGCATSTFQFSTASTADGTGGGSSSGSSSSGSSSVLLPAILGSVGALILVIASIFFIRRRRASKSDGPHHEDMDNQYLSPRAKPQPRSPERPTYAMDASLNNSTNDPSEPNSPTIDFDDASTPPASAAVRQPYEQVIERKEVVPTRQDFVAAPAPTQHSVQPEPQQQQQQPTAAPKTAHYSYVAPQSFSFSKPVEERPSTNNSFRSSTRSVPTFPAPVVPNMRVEEEEDDEDRSSFDIDDMRETEEIKERERMSSIDMVAPYSSDSAYVTGSVTSPQSYVRATSLRRNSSKAAPERPTLRYTSSHAAAHPSDSFSDRDSYASDAMHSSANPNTGSFRESTSGYSRESLGILGYPYAKKPSSRNSITEAQL